MKQQANQTKPLSNRRQALRQQKKNISSCEQKINLGDIKSENDFLSKIIKYRGNQTQQNRVSSETTRFAIT